MAAIFRSTSEEMQKIILLEDSKTGLSDAIADLLLCFGAMTETGEERDALLDEAWSEARDSAQRHYDAEAHGDSEGMHVFVDKQDGSPRIDLKETPA